MLSLTSRRPLLLCSTTFYRTSSAAQNLVRIRRASNAMPLSTHVVPPLKDKSLLKDLAYVNGNWIGAKSGKTFDVHDPASTEKIGSCPEMSREDVAAAIDHAAVAFKKFKLMSGRERARLLRRWYDLMVENASDITTLLTWENGKPTPDAKREAYFAADFLEWFSEEAPRMYGDHIPTSIAGNRVITIRQPIGVCGLITPWNFPAAMITRKAGPAIAAGCTVVVKAPGETPFTSLALAELSRRAGIPDGVFNVVTCLDNTPSVGQELCENPVVKKISFTGSTAVGRLLMQQCAPTLKKLSFELGGNAPFIIFDDADIEKAVDGAISSKFRCCGQTCICANRIYVQKGIYQQFAESFAKKVREFKVGSGYEEGVTHGPLIHGRAVDKVHEHVEDARAKGATVIVGGKRDEHLGPNFYGLTVITGMHKDMKLHQEETFGPVAGLFEFDTEQNVIELANSSEVGLAAYFYSRDVNRIWRVAEALEVGMVGINAPLVSDVVSPFGGVKQSGFGREGSKYGIDEFTSIKSMIFGGV